MRGSQSHTYPNSLSGILSLDKLTESLTPDTSLLSVIAVNNEIGVMQKMREIGNICRQKGVFFHTDAAQAVGKVNTLFSLVQI